jgi:hypothetical protein
MRNPWVIVLLVFTAIGTIVAATLYSYANATINNYEGFGASNPALQYSYAATSWLKFAGGSLVAALVTGGLRWPVLPAKSVADAPSESN